MKSIVFLFLFVSFFLFSSCDDYRKNQERAEQYLLDIARTKAEQVKRREEDFEELLYLEAKYLNALDRNDFKTVYDLKSPFFRENIPYDLFYKKQGKIDLSLHYDYSQKEHIISGVKMKTPPVRGKLWKYDYFIGNYITQLLGKRIVAVHCGDRKNRNFAKVDVAYDLLFFPHGLYQRKELTFPTYFIKKDGKWFISNMRYDNTVSISGKDASEIRYITEKEEKISAGILEKANKLYKKGDIEKAREQYRYYGMIKPQNIKTMVPEELQEASLPPAKVYSPYVDKELMRARQGQQNIIRMLMKYGAKPH